MIRHGNTPLVARAGVCVLASQLPTRHQGEKTCAFSSTQIGIISLVTSSCLREWVIIIGRVDSWVICIAETVRPCLYEDQVTCYELRRVSKAVVL